MSLMEQILLGRYEGSKQEHLDELVKDIRGVESSGGTLLVNPDSTARGDFQFLTGTGAGQNAFQTAINRFENTMKAKGHDVPAWIGEARSHNNPMALSYEQQKDLMLANIYQQKGSDALFSKALSGDVDAGKQLYYDYHHTNPDEATRTLADKHFQVVPVMEAIPQVPTTQPVMAQQPQSQEVPPTGAPFYNTNADGFITSYPYNEDAFLGSTINRTIEGYRSAEDTLSEFFSELFGDKDE